MKYMLLIHNDQSRYEDLPEAERVSHRRLRDPRARRRDRRPLAGCQVLRDGSPAAHAHLGRRSLTVPDLAEDPARLPAADDFGQRGQAVLADDEV